MRSSRRLTASVLAVAAVTAIGIGTATPTVDDVYATSLAPSCETGAATRGGPVAPIIGNPHPNSGLWPGSGRVEVRGSVTGVLSVDGCAFTKPGPFPVQEFALLKAPKSARRIAVRTQWTEVRGGVVTGPIAVALAPFTTERAFDRAVEALPGEAVALTLPGLGDTVYVDATNPIQLVATHVDGQPATFERRIALAAAYVDTAGFVQARVACQPSEPSWQTTLRKASRSTASGAVAVYQRGATDYTFRACRHDGTPVADRSVLLLKAPKSARALVLATPPQSADPVIPPHTEQAFDRMLRKLTRPTELRLPGIKRRVYATSPDASALKLLATRVRGERPTSQQRYRAADAYLADVAAVAAE